MESILLRKAKKEDAAEILNITKKAFEKYAEQLDKRDQVTALKETIADIESDISNKHVYVCVVDGDMKGAVRFDVLAQGIAYLSRFAIDPESQSLGLGGLLLEKVRLECKRLGVRAITLHTASKMRSSVSFYLKNGYYIHSITRDRDYIRAFMVNELVKMDELFDYESIVRKK